jgi:ATP-binding cassette subfamily B multidrug efflux pump
MPDKIGSILHKAKLITDSDLHQAIVFHREQDIQLGEALVQLNMITREDLTFALVKQIQARYENVHNMFKLTGLRSLWKQLWEYRAKIIPLSIYMLMANIMTLLFPVITGFFIDNILVTSNFILFPVLIGIICVLYLFKSILFFLGEYVFTDMICQFSRALKMNLYLFFNILSYSVFSKFDKGDLLNRVTANIDNMEEYLRTAMTEVFSNVPLFIMITIVLARMNWVMTIIIVPLMFCTIFLPSKIANGAAPYLDREKKAIGQISAFLKEQFSNFFIIKLYNREKPVSDNLGKLLRHYFSNMFRIWFHWNSSFQVNQMLAIFFAALTLWMGGAAVINGTLTTGSLVTFYLLISYLLPAMMSITSVFVRLSLLKVDWGRVFDILKQERQVMRTGEKTRDSALETKGTIKCTGVSYSYPDGTEIFNRMSCELQSGRSYGVLGRSGSGKSTLFNLLLGLLTPSEGTISLDSVNLSMLSQWDISKNIAYMAQDSFLFNASVSENIKYGAYSFNIDCSDEEVARVSRLANIHDQVSLFPDGYDTVIGESGYSLSSGESQRVALARAFLKKPSIFMFDEPIASLDPDNRKIITDTIVSLTGTYTVLVATHDLDLLSRLQNLVVLENGKTRILEDRNEIEMTLERYREQNNEE